MGNDLEMSEVLLVACFWINKERSFYLLQRYSFRGESEHFVVIFFFVFLHFTSSAPASFSSWLRCESYAEKRFRHNLLRGLENPVNLRQRRRSPLSY